MASNDWKRENPKISGHIPKSLKAKLEQFIEDRGLKSTSEALRIILGTHFKGAEFSTSSQLPSKSSQPVVNSLEERLKSIESRLKKHSDIIRGLQESQKSQESAPKVRNSVDNSKSKSSQLVVNRSQLTIFDGWLTTGEAYAELKKRGYEKSQVTLRRTLKKGKVTKELENLGLTADFEVRKAANLKDNSVRWLKVE